MRGEQHGAVKRYLVLALLGFVGMAVIMVTLTRQPCRAYQMEENKSIAALLTQVQQTYPEANLTELIQTLNGIGPEPDYELLRQYGITEDSYFIKEMEAQEKRIIRGNCMVLCFLEILMLGIFFLYRRRREKKIGLLNRYMARVAGGDYDLDLDANSEDELSNLKNQLYKITLMMREQADVASNQKKALADSVSDISHQLKTPLTSISIFLDNLLESREMEPYIQRRFLQEIDHQITSMNWMVISMLKLSRLDAGVVEFEETEIVLEKLLNEVCVNLEVIAELQEVTVEMQGFVREESSIAIQGDYNWNREAVTNIVKNAIEHSRPGSTVRICVEQNAVYTAIYVTNRGETISKEDQKHIFTRYYSAANGDGTGIGANNVGLGLPLAKAIMEKQNGYLTVESGEGKTTFCMKYIAGPRNHG